MRSKKIKDLAVTSKLWNPLREAGYMLIINCGITRVVCERKYHAGAESEAMFEEPEPSRLRRTGEIPTIEAKTSELNGEDSPAADVGDE